MGPKQSTDTNIFTEDRITAGSDGGTGHLTGVCDARSRITRIQWNSTQDLEGIKFFSNTALILQIEKTGKGVWHETDIPEDINGFKFYLGKWSHLGVNNTIIRGFIIFCRSGLEIRIGYTPSLENSNGDESNRWFDCNFHGRAEIEEVSVRAGDKIDQLSFKLRRFDAQGLHSFLHISR